MSNYELQMYMNYDIYRGMNVRFLLLVYFIPVFEK